MPIVILGGVEQSVSEEVCRDLSLLLRAPYWSLPIHIYYRQDATGDIHLGEFLVLVHGIRTELNQELCSKWFKLAVFGVEH